MNKVNMKKAVVDQIILWIVLFIVFVGFLFFIIDYSNAIKVKDNTDAVADYVARMTALNKNDAEIIAGANTIKEDYFATITEANLNCVENNALANHQVIMNVFATLVNNFLPVGNNNVHSKVVVFNEASEFQKECTLTLLFN
jgi:Flp pilus assembly protein TadG